MSHLNVPVEEFTTPNPITCGEDASVDELASLMKANGIRHLPVVRDSRVVGIVSDRDVRLIAGLDLEEKGQIRASDIMVLDPVSVESNMSLDEVAFIMSSKKIGSVIVNEEDLFLGIFTVTDALNALIEIIRSKSDRSDD